MSDDFEAAWAAHEEQVDPEELERARAAAAPDQVVCYECAQAFGQITAQHLRIHDITLEEYRNSHPDAPIYPRDAARQPGREPGFEHNEETKQKIAEGVRRNHERGVYE